VVTPTKQIISRAGTSSPAAVSAFAMAHREDMRDANRVAINRLKVPFDPCHTDGYSEEGC
jgi:hypothetical protein